MRSKKSLVLIPAYNEEKNLKKTVDGVFSKNKDVDVLVVNDGSKDKTRQVAESTRADVANHPYNMGYGVALQTGYKYAMENGYDILVQIDADGQHDPKYIKEIIRQLEETNSDLVIGSRFKNRHDYRAPILRRAGMIVFNSIVNKITGWNLTDCTSGYQAIRNSVFSFLASDNFPVDYPDADLLIMLYFRGYKVTEMTMKMYQNKEGRSMHGNLLKNFYYVAKMFLSIFVVCMQKITGLIKKDAAS